jgi:AAA domain
MLKGIKPEVVKARKPHIMLSGEAGTGKTYFSLNWPAPYFIDTESGATREQYVKRLKEAEGVYFGPEQGSQDFQGVLGQIRELATTKHPYRTLVIDSFSKLYNLEAAAAEDRIGSDFGKDKREADKPTRKLLTWLERLPMNVILICHQKDKWERRERELIYVGSTYDGYKKLHYELDLWLQTKMVGTKRFATIAKSRIDAFPAFTDINLDFPTFEKLYGASVIDEEVAPIILSTPEQVDQIKKLVEAIRITEEEMDKYLAKLQATEIEDLSKENATKLLEYLTKRSKGEAK